MRKGMRKRGEGREEERGKGREEWRENMRKGREERVKRGAGSGERGKRIRNKVEYRYKTPIGDTKIILRKYTVT